MGNRFVVGKCRGTNALLMAKALRSVPEMNQRMMATSTAEELVAIKDTNGCVRSS